MPAAQQLPTAAVTGATGAIGQAICLELASRGFQVIMITRDPQKSRRVRDEIRERTGREHIHYLLTDLSRRQAVQELSEKWSSKLKVLINNAAVTPQTRQETPEGIELQFATNVLGYFWMMEAFFPVLERSAPSRIINVASYWAGGLDLSDLEFKRRPYRNGAAYRQSKQADRMLSRAFAERFLDHGITVNSCHPGDVNSTLSNNLGFGGHQTPAQGAETPVWLATAPEAAEFTGKYFENKSETRCSFSENQKEVEALYEICHNYH